jgi:DNA-binding NtrC family response regulator
LIKRFNLDRTQSPYFGRWRYLITSKLSLGRGSKDHSTFVLPPTVYCLEEIEKHHILMVLNETKGNRGRAASLLGIDRKTLYTKNKKISTRVSFQQRCI